MVEAIEKAGVVSQVGFHMRFRASVSKLKQILDEGSAGRTTMFTGRFWCNMLGKDWWQRKDGSGGQIYEQLIHIYDLALHLLGQPDSVCGFMDNLTHTHVEGYTIEDTSIGTIRFADGSLATITGSNSALGWDTNGDGLPGSGSGAASMGQELANSEAFAVCQVKKVFKTVCLREPIDTDMTDFNNMVSSFKSSGYKLKQVFAETADYCKGD